MHNEKHHDLYSSPNVTGKIKSRRVSWWGMWNIWRRREIHIWFLRGKLKERNNLDDTGTNGIILNWIFKKQNGKAWAGFNWIRRDKWCCVVCWCWHQHTTYDTTQWGPDPLWTHTYNATLLGLHCL
jgi:hypothetical protein